MNGALCNGAGAYPTVDIRKGATCGGCDLLSVSATVE